MNLKFMVLLAFSTQVGLSINPMKEYKMTPEAFKLEYQEIKIETADGYELNTWIMEPAEKQDQDITIVIAGSDAGNMGFNLPYAFYLLRAGYRVVTFDYRGFGESTDFDYNPDFVYHSEYIVDFVTVLEWCKKELKTEDLGVLAFSMGTFISAVGYTRGHFDFYIGEGFITSPQAIKKRVKKQKNKDLMLPKTAVTDEMTVKNLDIPILLFASTTDEVTTADDSLGFCSKKQSAKTIQFEGEHLRGAATLGMENYINEIQSFIKTR